MAGISMKINLDQTCRLCLAQGGVLSPIFEESVGGGSGGGGPGRVPVPGQRAPPPQPALPSRIMACVSVSIEEGDELPAQICHRCLYQVERSFDFKEQCEQSDDILRHYVAKLKEADPEVQEANFPVKDEPIREQSRTNSPVNFSINSNRDDVEEKQGSEKPEPKAGGAQSQINSTGSSLPITVKEEDVDSGLLESLADSEDLQVIGSEGDNVALGDEEEPNSSDRVKEELTDKSEAEEDIRLRCKMCKETFADIDVLENHEAAHEANGPPFSCSICEKAFTERSLLEAHWSVHCGDHPFVCPVCESPFASNESLENHLRSHKISRPYSCSTCDKSFGSRSDLKKHTVIHSGLRPYKCKICPKEFSRSTNLNKHIRVHSGQRPFTCSECPKMFRTKGDLHRHEIIHTGQKPFSCAICNLSFNRKDKLTRHERLHTSEKVFTCTLCSATFYRRDDLAKHSLLHISLPLKLEGELERDAQEQEPEPEQEVATDLSMPSKKEQSPEHDSQQFASNDDESTMDTESDNQLHICEDSLDEDTTEPVTDPKDMEDGDEKNGGVESMVISVDPFQMERMDTSDSSQVGVIMKPTTFSSLKSEEDKEELSPNENDVEENIQENTKPYGCEFCPKKFADKSYMKTHQLTHLGIRPHACSYCGKGFFRRRELLRHEAVHTGIKPFICKICQKAFARSDKLMRHERTHGEPKNFSCSQCPAVFSRKDELSRHAMCHTGERPHCCSQCFKSFFSKAELTRHEKTHAGLKPFKCDFCDQSFHRRDKLNRHVRTHMNPGATPTEASVLGTVHLHDLLARCGQHFAAEACERDEKSEEGEELKVRVDGSIDARALARLNQNPDIHLIPLKQN